MSRSSEREEASSAQPHLGRRRHNFEEGEVSYTGSKSSRPESHEVEDDNEGRVWPELFVEALARKLALEASLGGGALAAAPDLVTVFQVCSTWRAISHSEILWESLVQLIWDTPQTPRRSQSWRDEYIRLHLTASNFRHNRAKYTLIEYEVSSDSSGNGAGAVCRCLTLSPEYLAVGFFDGAVRIFSLASKECVNTVKPIHDNRLGSLSRAISGIVIYRDNRVVFASLDGSVFVGGVSEGLVRCAHAGNVVNDGTLVDFTGSEKYWVGLYAGIPGHACHIWDAVTEELLFNAGDVTDLDALRGWRLLTEQAERIGRVKVNRDGFLLTATRFKVTLCDLESHGVGFSREEIAVDGQQLIVESLDVNKDCFLTALDGGAARIRRIIDFEDCLAFSFTEAATTVDIPTNSTIDTDRSSGGNYSSELPDGKRVLGALNTRQAFLCIEGAVHAWDARSGMRIYRLSEWVGEVFDLVADDEHVASCSIDTGIHLWSFSP